MRKMRDRRCAPFLRAFGLKWTPCKINSSMHAHMQQEFMQLKQHLSVCRKLSEQDFGVKEARNTILAQHHI